VSERKKELEAIYQKFKLDYYYVPEEQDITDLLSVLLPLDVKYHLWLLGPEYPPVGSMHREFAELARAVMAETNGKVKARVNSKFEFESEDGECEEDGLIKISFKHNNSDYKWTFTSDNYEQYIEELSIWAEQVLEGAFHITNNSEQMIAWRLQADALEELKVLVG